MDLNTRKFDVKYFVLTQVLMRTFKYNLLMPRSRTNRLFQARQYRIYNPFEEVRLEEEFLVFHQKSTHRRSTRIGDHVSYCKSKLSFIQEASFKIKLDLLTSPKETILHAEAEKMCFLNALPKEAVFRILEKLTAKDLLNFSKTSRYARWISYDNTLWREITCKLWRQPDIFQLNIDKFALNLRQWYNYTNGKSYSTDQVLILFKQNIWRIIYVALHLLDSVPSIVYPAVPLFQSRATECYAASHTVVYMSTKGNFKLKGVEQVGRIEYVVFNFISKPWHKREFGEMIAIPIFTLRNYGLKMARSLRGQHGRGFFRRRGYYLKSDQNRKLHLTYRYFPTVRFRLFHQKGGRVFLLCQDLHITGGEQTECFTMYEIIKLPDITSSDDETVKFAQLDCDEAEETDDNLTEDAE